MRHFESRPSSYKPGSYTTSVAEGSRRQTDKLNNLALAKEREQSNSLVIKTIVEKLQDTLAQENLPQVQFIINERNPVRGQPDIEVTLSNIHVTPTNINFSKSDHPETEINSLAHYSFCLLTHLAIRGERDFLKENIDLTNNFSKKNTAKFIDT